MAQLFCYYCERGLAREHTPPVLPGKEREVIAQVTMHDKRGCFHVCFGHASWRLTKAFAFGHSSDCPYHHP